VSPSAPAPAVHECMHIGEVHPEVALGYDRSCTTDETPGGPAHEPHSGYPLPARRALARSVPTALDDESTPSAPIQTP
jgi:hypothetical protein